MKSLFIKIESTYIKHLKKIIYLVIFSLLVWSCGSSKPAYSKTPNKPNSANTNLKNLKSTIHSNTSYQVKKILNDAEDYLGTPYKSGGITNKGFDCSGFVTTVFLENNYKLPRRSEDQAKEGKKIEITEVKPGDLLFFATSGTSKVSHVAIVREIKYNGEITFIHASTSKGVIISSLNEKYWNNAFLFARRVL